MGGSLGVWKRVLWVCFCKRRVAGVLSGNFACAGVGSELGSGHGCFLGNFGMDPS